MFQQKASKNVLEGFCFLNENNHLSFDLSYFKHLNLDDDNTIKIHILETLKEAKECTIHINLEQLQIIQVEKKWDKLKPLLEFFASLDYELKTCYIYKPTLIFQALQRLFFSIFSKELVGKITIIHD
jgi:hypothetical protein